MRGGRDGVFPVLRDGKSSDLAVEIKSFVKEKNIVKHLPKNFKRCIINIDNKFLFHKRFARAKVVYETT